MIYIIRNTSPCLHSAPSNILTLHVVRNNSMCLHNIPYSHVQYSNKQRLITSTITSTITSNSVYPITSGGLRHTDPGYSTTNKSKKYFRASYFSCCAAFTVVDHVSKDSQSLRRRLNSMLAPCSHFNTDTTGNVVTARERVGQPSTPPPRPTPSTDKKGPMSYPPPMAG